MSGFFGILGSDGQKFPRISWSVSLRFFASADPMAKRFGPNLALEVVSHFLENWTGKAGSPPTGHARIEWDYWRYTNRRARGFDRDWSSVAQKFPLARRVKISCCTLGKFGARVAFSGWAPAVALRLGDL
jgi:hypothetical protein